MVNLSEEKLKEAKLVFSLYEGSENRIRFKNLGTAVRSLGINMTDPEIEDIIKEMKFIGNSEIDLPNFIAIIS